MPGFEAVVIASEANGSILSWRAKRSHLHEIASSPPIAPFLAVTMASSSRETVTLLAMTVVSHMTKTFRTSGIAASIWLLAVNTALACPVCFGASDSPLVHGSNLAILALLGVTVGVLGAFAAFFLHLKRLAARLAVSSRTNASG